MLKPFLMILVAMVGITTIVWGFPGAYLLAAVVPAFILGASIAHLRQPREEGGQFRPGVIVLGGVFGLITGSFAVMLMWAATAPEDVTIIADVRVEAATPDVWATVSDPSQRPRWHTWLIDVEPIGRGGPIAVGNEYRSMMAMERHQVPGHHEITEVIAGQRFVWTVEPPAGARLQHMVEAVDVAPDGDATHVRYSLTYKVPTVLGRLFDRLVVRRSIEKVADASLQELAGIASEL